jgi:hypothetical protein
MSQGFIEYGNPKNVILSGKERCEVCVSRDNLQYRKRELICAVCMEIIKRREEKIDLEFPNTVRFK